MSSLDLIGRLETLWTAKKGLEAALEKARARAQARAAKVAELRAHENGRAKPALGASFIVLAVLGVLLMLPATTVTVEALAIFLETRRPGGNVERFDLLTWLGESPTNLCIIFTPLVFVVGGKAVDFLWYLLRHARWFAFLVGFLALVGALASAVLFSEIMAAIGVGRDIIVEIDSRKASLNVIEIRAANIGGCATAADSAPCRELARVEDDIARLEARRRDHQVGSVQRLEPWFRLAVLLTDLLASALAFIVLAEWRHRSPAHLARLRHAEADLKAADDEVNHLKGELDALLSEQSKLAQQLHPAPRHQPLSNAAE